jgi:ribonuclease P protein component
MISSEDEGKDEIVENVRTSEEQKSDHNSQFSIFNFQFNKFSRIVSKKVIEQLFNGHDNASKAAYPIRIVVMAQERTEGQPNAQVLISVSKRHFKHAVDRNRVKRQLREAYRLNQQLLTNRVPEGTQVCLAFIWLSNEHAPSDVVAARMRRLLKFAAEKINAKDDK